MWINLNFGKDYLSCLYVELFKDYKSTPFFRRKANLQLNWLTDLTILSRLLISNLFL